MGDYYDTLVGVVGGHIDDFLADYDEWDDPLKHLQHLRSACNDILRKPFSELAEMFYGSEWEDRVEEIEDFYG